MMPETEIDPEKWKDVLVLLNVISNRNVGDKSPLGLMTQAFLTRLRQKILQEEGQALRSEALGTTRRLTPRFDTMLSASKRVASAFLRRQSNRQA